MSRESRRNDGVSEILDLVGLTYEYQDPCTPPWRTDIKESLTFSTDPNEVLLTLFFNHPRALSQNADAYNEIYGRGLPHLLLNHHIDQETIDIVFGHLHKDYKNRSITTFLLQGNRKHPSPHLTLAYLKDVISRADHNHLAELLSTDYYIIYDNELLNQALKFAIEIVAPRDQSHCIFILSTRVPIFRYMRHAIRPSLTEAKQFQRYKKRLLERYDCDGVTENNSDQSESTDNSSSQQSASGAPTITHVGFQVYGVKFPDKIEVLSTIQTILKTTEDHYHLHNKGDADFVARAVTSEISFSQYVDATNQVRPIVYTAKEWCLLVEGMEFIARHTHRNVQALIGTFIVRMNDNKTVSYCVHIECGLSPCISVKAKFAPHRVDLNYDSAYQPYDHPDGYYRSELYSDEFVNDGNNQTITFDPIIPTRTITQVVDICNDVNHGAATCRLVRGAILNRSPIDPRLCYTVIATSLVSFHYIHPMRTFGARVYGAQESLKNGAIVTAHMEVCGIRSQDKYKSKEIQIAPIQYSNEKGFFYSDTNDTNSTTIGTFFFYKPLGTTQATINSKSGIDDGSNRFSLDCAGSSGGTLNNTIFAYCIDDVGLHNRAVLTVRAHDACVASGFFSTKCKKPAGNEYSQPVTSLNGID